MLAIGAEQALPNWYLGAGGIAQTVWNLQHGVEPAVGIKDYDLVHFDPADLSVEADRQVDEEVAGRLSGRGAVVDVKNQARVHLWYEQRFGPHIEPFTSTEEAIATWPTTASSVGVRRDSGGFVAWAPFGLTDLLGMVVRPNKAMVTRELKLAGPASRRDYS